MSEPFRPVLERSEILQALKRLGELAFQSGNEIELFLVGGAALVLLYDARPSTRDLDVVILRPRQASIARKLAAQVAQEMGLPADWLNDGVKGFVVGHSLGPTVLQAPGIFVKTAAIDHLLAMKLSAWRDDVDIADATRLLQELSGQKDEIWRRIEKHLVPNTGLKAHYAFLDLWESLYGES